MKKIIVSVTNDLSTDQRVSKVCNSLLSVGFDVLLVGRELKDSLPLERSAYKVKRMHLFFTKGAFFYTEYNIRLFFFLLFKKTDILVANDLDTLLANFLISKFKGIELVYDSHEYFTEVPELLNRKFIQSIWKFIERIIFPQLKYVYTVSPSIAELYAKEYHVDISIIRNAPIRKELTEAKTKKELDLPLDKNIIILQGAINIDRGIEEAVEAVQYIKDVLLLIIGSGDIIYPLKQKVVNLSLSNKVKFISKLPFQHLFHYTANADIGLTLEKPTNINYRYSLPNKLFDYIHAGIPVLASPLVEIKKIVNQYNIGVLIDNHEPRHIAAQIKYMLSHQDKIKEWRANTKIAANELCWQNEEKKLLALYNRIN